MKTLLTLIALWMSGVVGDLAMGCPLAPVCASAEVAVPAQVVQADVSFLGVAPTFVPQAVVVSPGYVVAPSVVASGVVAHSEGVVVRRSTVFRSRLAPMRASSRVTIRTRVR
ncbi:MAG: hypothetical protein KF708_02605 [Pirellulales bacterium]|nr:hypothetical protein [Pirellulales bacterium]